MKLLFTFDKKDYTDDMPLVERYGVRAIIRQGDKFAMQKGSLGEFKIPGGGVEEGESLEQALIREVREETGLQVMPETIKEIGEAVEIKQDQKCKGKKYIAHSLFYECQVGTEMSEPQMTASEISRGYHLEWEDLEHIIAANMEHQDEDWIIRDTEFLRRLHDGLI